MQEDVGTTRKKRHLELVQGKKNTPSEFFYRVSNPGALAKIGQSYLDDFKMGVKSFAISSTNYKASQQRTVLALASYFDHLFDMKILIITDSPHKGVFEELMNVREVEHRSFPSSDKTVEINHFYHHFDVVDLNKLLALTTSDKPTFDFEVVMDSLIKSYDIVFWDTPIINTQRNNSKVYAHTLNYFESLTIVVSPAVSRVSDVNEIKAHFSSFGVNVKGVLFDNPGMDNDQRTKKASGE